jgi:FAD/FMN-containing dehydrogenase
VLEQAAWKEGQALWMYPSTMQSTIGGFLSGGSGGTGTIEHGSNDMGYVLALDVVHADGSPDLVHVEGDEAQRYVHNYGTAGIIARATVRLEPLREWVGLYASFPTLQEALPLVRTIGRLTPPPRLVSADNPAISATLPPDDAIPVGRASLRAILSTDQVAEATALIESAGGRVEAIRDGQQTSMRISMLSYNHPIEWLQKSTPIPTFHVEVSGEALIDRLAEVEAVYPRGLLHIEAGHSVPIGMLAGEYISAEQVLDGIPRLNELGVGVHNPHQWNVDFAIERTVETAQRTDPDRLLNPGKLNPDYAGPRKGAIR